MNGIPENWEKIRTKMPVHIPTVDGQGIAETKEVEVDAWRNPNNGEIYLDGEALKQLDDVKARYFGLMLPDEIKELRDQFGVTQKRMAELLEIGEKSYCRWETGRERPSRSMNLLLTAVRDGRIDVAYLLAKKQPTFEWRKTLEPPAGLFPASRPTAKTEVIKRNMERSYELVAA